MLALVGQHCNKLRMFIPYWENHNALSRAAESTEVAVIFRSDEHVITNDYKRDSNKRMLLIHHLPDILDCSVDVLHQKPRASQISNGKHFQEPSPADAVSHPPARPTHRLYQS